MTDYLLRHGEWDGVSPGSAGWRYLSFAVERGSFACGADDVERVLVPLGGDCRVEAGGQAWELPGRENVFAAMPSALYLPRDTAFEAHADGEVAVCGAVCSERREPLLVPPDDVEVEVRGAGNATRQINHIVKPDFPAERILVVEVFTPAGNWSSYPPHKHDTDAMPDEALLEETYYHRLRGGAGFAFQRVYTDDGSLDEGVAVEDGDVVLVPRGYHPVACDPRADLYYLNVMAGPVRAWRVTVAPGY